MSGMPCWLVTLAIEGLLIGAFIVLAVFVWPGIVAAWQRWKDEG